MGGCSPKISARCNGNYLQIVGRASERIKIGGELVNLARLRQISKSSRGDGHGIQNRVALIAVPGRAP